MSDDNSSLATGGEVVPAITPKSDAEAAVQTTTPPIDEAAKAAADKVEADKQADEKKKNRTRDYINKLNRENAELRQRAQELAALQQPRQPQQRQDGQRGPTLADYDYNLDAFQNARDAWVIQQAEQGWSARQQQQAAQAREQSTWQTYESRAADFADAHPDFLEVVGSIRYPLSDALQDAIARHDRGPELSYHLGTNDDDAFQLASIQPHLAAAAVDRLAARLSAAPSPTALAAVQAPTRPLSQTPPPVPTVSGRSPTDTPAEKLTDDAWLAREQAKRKR